MASALSFIALLVACAVVSAQEDPTPGFAVDSEGNLINIMNQGNARGASLGLGCRGNCIGNTAGNNNGNDNINSNNNGNFNGNCHGNCIGNVIGNSNGNKNTDSDINGNRNGNCVGNCYHNFLGNGNGNKNNGVDNNGNGNGDCFGNCFHYVSGNFNGNGNGALGVSSRNSIQEDGRCVGHCVGEGPSAAAAGAAVRSANFDYTASSITCSVAGWTYYVTEGSQCNDITKEGHGHLINFSCPKETVFDIDICACNRWWYVDFKKTCRSGTGHEIAL